MKTPAWGHNLLIKASGLLHPDIDPLDPPVDTYTGLGMRLRKNDPTGNYWYDADGVAPASPVLSDGYSTFTPGISEINGSGSRFYLADAQGNSRGLLDGNQENTDGYNWDGWGNSVSRFGANPTGSAWNEESGYQSDNDSGLKLLGHRYYDSRTGRFISQDPIGDGDNWYAYADNDPTDETDPTGLSTPLYHNLGADFADGTGEMSIGDPQQQLWLSQWSCDRTRTYSGTGLVATEYGPERLDWTVPLTMGGGLLGGGFMGSSKPQPPQHEGLGHYLIRQLLSGGQADNHNLGPPSSGLFGGKPNVAKNQVNTSAGGGRAAAKSLFRKLSKGKKVISSTSRDGSIRRYTEDGSVQIRMKSNGTTNVDIQRPSGKEDVHFN